MPGTPARSVPADMERFLDQLARRTGLDWRGSQRERMLDTVRRAKEVEQAQSYSVLARVVEHDAAAWGRLIDALTVGETYFFREPAHLDLLRVEARRAIEHRADRRGLRIWSAGCASGEEVYTLAMVLSEEGLLRGSRIVGTDISADAVGRARAGLYQPRSLRRCNVQQRRMHFEESRAGFRPVPAVTSAVELSIHNVVDGPIHPGYFDMVFCRNLLMYLDAAGRERALSALRDALVPGGWLIVGSADPPPDVDGIELVRTEHCVAYRRVAQGATVPPDARIDRRVDVRSRPVGSAPARSTRRPAEEVAQPSLLAPAPTVEAHVGDLSVAHVRSLASRGHVGEAGQLMRRAIAARPLDPELRYLAASVHLHARHLDEAARAATAATYLDPTLAAAHLLLGHIDVLRGNAERARRSYQNALELLSAVAPDTAVPLADGESAGVLAAVAADLAGGTWAT